MHSTSGAGKLRGDSMVGAVIYNQGERTSYVLEEALESGKEGASYRATQHGPDGGATPVALKLVVGEEWLGLNVSALAMLDRWTGQAQRVRSFNHEGFAAAHVAFLASADPARPEDTPASLLGAPAFVVEWIEGQRLDRWSKTRDSAERVAVLQLAAEAIDAFHTRMHSVHGDLKPDNILVEGDRTRIIDFGLVRAVERMNTGSHFLGAMGYLDPHLFETREYTQAVDRFAFAGVVYHQLLLEHPIPGRHAPRIAQQLRAAYGDAVAWKVGKALSPDPTLRGTTGAASFLADVLASLDPPTAHTGSGSRASSAATSSPSSPGTTATLPFPGPPPVPTAPTRVGLPVIEDESVGRAVRQVGLVLAVSIAATVAVVFLLNALPT